MEIERYFIKVNEENVAKTIVEERIREAERNLRLAERIIEEKLGNNIKK
jgi:hypothetical protein